MILLWSLAGVLVGAANALTLFLTVDQLRPGAPSRVVAMVVGGMATRLVLVTLLLAVALRSDIISGLLAFGGLWVFRWAAVIWVQTHRPPWSYTSPATIPAPSAQSRRNRGNMRAIEREGRPGS